MSGVRTRITDRGVIQESISNENGGASASILSVEVPVSGLSVGNENTVTWSPFASGDEAITNGWYMSWSDAVAAIQNLTSPVTYLQIEADPWQDEVVIPAGKWTLNNTMIVGKVGYAQGGRNWVASRDAGNQGLNAGWQYYNQQYRGHQVKLWVHPEYDNLNPCIIKGCIGLKDMFFRGVDIDSYIGGNNATFSNYVENPYDGGTGTAILTIDPEGGDTFSEADLWTDIDTDADGGWYVTVIEVIDAYTVKVDTQGDPSWLYESEGGVYTVVSWDTDNGDRMNATFNLRGRLGGRESYFSAYNSSTNSSTLVRGYDHSGPSSSDNQFHFSMVGSKIKISSTNTDGGEHNGEYTILNVYDDNTVEIDLDVDMTGSDGSGDRNVNWTTVDHTDEFTLDNVDFRSPYGEFGSLNLWRGNMFLHLKGGASIRNQSVSTDGFMVIQSEGAPAWMGGYSVYSYNGDGYLKIYALPGMDLNNDWLEGNANVNFDIYQGNVPYIPNNYGNWSGTRPYSVSEALDRLAAAVDAAGYTP